MLLSSLVNKNLLIYVNLNNRSISILSTRLFINYFRLDLAGRRILHLWLLIILACLGAISNLKSNYIITNIFLYSLPNQHIQSENLYEIFFCLLKQHIYFFYLILHHIIFLIAHHIL